MNPVIQRYVDIKDWQLYAESLEVEIQRLENSHAAELSAIAQNERTASKQLRRLKAWAKSFARAHGATVPVL